MIQGILRVIVILSFMVSMIWFIYEPGFDPFLTMLGCIVALITLLREHDKTVSQATRDLPEQGTSKDAEVAPSIKRSSTLQAFRGNLTEREWVIVGKLRTAFMILKNLVPIICIISIIFVLILFATMVFEAEGIIVISIGLFWLFSILNVYVFMMKKWYERVVISGFYGSIKSVAKRKEIKDALYQQEWGNALLNLYMRILVSFLLKPNQKEADKAQRQIKLG